MGGERALNLGLGRDVQRRVPQRGSKELLFAKVRSKELKIFNILWAYELKFWLNLGWTTETSSKFLQNSLVIFIYSQVLLLLLKEGVL